MLRPLVFYISVAKPIQTQKKRDDFLCVFALDVELVRFLKGIAAQFLMEFPVCGRQLLWASTSCTASCPDTNFLL